MKKKSVLLFLVGLAGLGFLLFWRLGWGKKKGGEHRLMVGGHQLAVELVSTPAERDKGLSDRKSFCNNCGMLFIFDQPDFYPFWMRRMYFDIDILWIAGDRVVDITYGAKAPSKEEFDAPKTLYQSGVSVDKVLEVNSGWVKENGVKIGDRLEY